MKTLWEYWDHIKSKRKIWIIWVQRSECQKIYIKRYNDRKIPRLRKIQYSNIVSLVILAYPKDIITSFQRSKTQR